MKKRRVVKDDNSPTISASMISDILEDETCSLILQDANGEVAGSVIYHKGDFVLSLYDDWEEYTTFEQLFEDYYREYEFILKTA